MIKLGYESVFLDSLPSFLYCMNGWEICEYVEVVRFVYKYADLIFIMQNGRKTRIDASYLRIYKYRLIVISTLNLRS